MRNFQAISTLTQRRLIMMQITIPGGLRMTGVFEAGKIVDDAGKPENLLH